MFDYWRVNTYWIKHMKFWWQKWGKIVVYQTNMSLDFESVTLSGPMSKGFVNLWLCILYTNGCLFLMCFLCFLLLTVFLLHDYLFLLACGSVKLNRIRKYTGGDGNHILGSKLFLGVYGSMIPYSHYSSKYHHLQLWPWPPVITGYFYGMRNILTDGVTS